MQRGNTASSPTCTGSAMTRDSGVANTLIDPLVMRYKTDPRLADS